MSITYVEINGIQYPATIGGRMKDKDWDERESKTIHFEATYEEAKNLFVDNASWNIVQESEEMVETFDEEGNLIVNENGEPVLKVEIVKNVFDNSDFCIAGPITDNRDGTIDVKMGKFTNEELLLMEVLA